jgi:hypothetical protein
MKIPGLMSTMLLAAIALAGCQPAPPPAPTIDARARKDLDAYEALVAAKSYELAYPLGEDLLKRYPQGPIADAVMKTQPEVRATAEATIKGRQLAALWDYQVGEQSGGRQSSASIYSSVPGGSAKLRLILRRHSAWGESVYVFGAAPGFRCGSSCKLAIEFDGKAADWKAHSPPTGEPAVFIDDDKAFVAALVKAKSLVVHLTDAGGKPVEARYEVGGYDPSKYKPL